MQLKNIMGNFTFIERTEFGSLELRGWERRSGLKNTWTRKTNILTTKPRGIAAFGL